MGLAPSVWELFQPSQSWPSAGDVAERFGVATGQIWPAMDCQGILLLSRKPYNCNICQESR